MSEQPEGYGVFNRLFNAASRARQELAARNDDSTLLSTTRRLFRRRVHRVRGGSVGRRENPFWQAKLFLLPGPDDGFLPPTKELEELAKHGLGVLLFSQNRIYGAEVEMKVRPGDNITLYCDRSVTHGFIFVWIRNCSHEDQPSLEIDFKNWDQNKLQRYDSVYNRSSNSHDLHITNISGSDLGLYYCGEVENKIYKDEKGIIFSSKVYYYGNQTTRLSFAEKVTSCSSDITSTLPLSDCVLCWTLLFSVCPVCVLLSSLCVYCLCQRKTADAATDQKDHLKSGNTIEGEEEAVCYASLDVITRRQKQRKTKRVQCSDFSTYAQVRTETE